LANGEAEGAHIRFTKQRLDDRVIRSEWMIWCHPRQSARVVALIAGGPDGIGSTGVDQPVGRWEGVDCVPPPTTDRTPLSAAPVAFS
jgi:hypothetical protein